MIDFGLGVYLDRISERDLQDLINWRNDPRTWRWTRQNDVISWESHMDWFKKQASDNSMSMYDISESSNNGLIGCCGLTSIDWKNRRAEFSLYIEPEEQQKGYGKKALLTLFHHGFKNMGLHQIWGESFEGNPAIKLFKDIGMHEDGRRRQFYWKDGKFHDAIIFSVLQDEFSGDRSCFG